MHVTSPKTLAEELLYHVSGWVLGLTAATLLHEAQHVRMLLDNELAELLVDGYRVAKLRLTGSSSITPARLTAAAAC